MLGVYTIHVAGIGVATVYVIVRTTGVQNVNLQITVVVVVTEYATAVQVTANVLLTVADWPPAQVLQVQPGQTVALQVAV